jgi:hypothetical protein
MAKVRRSLKVWAQREKTMRYIFFRRGKVLVRKELLGSEIGWWSLERTDFTLGMASRLVFSLLK